jgi:4-diphosphocytidyl-2-C-methyl-D-erythritol kinase
VLRLADGSVEGLDSIAAGLGADVPSQLRPRFTLVTGAGETLEPLPPAGEWAAVLIPDEAGLATADVYAEADRLGLCRDRGELALARDWLLGVAPGASPLDYAELLVNDLQAAAISLRPAIGEALSALRQAGAEHALVTGSGPTAVGLFRDIAKADAGASALPYAYSSAIVTSPASLA